MNTVNMGNQTLIRARRNYGSVNQILVAIEELNELACVLAKYPRYDSKEKALEELHTKVVDEFADVLIILNHVQAIFELEDDEIESRMISKLDRVKRWLDSSESFQHTTEDREVVQAIDILKENISKSTQDSISNKYCWTCEERETDILTEPCYSCYMSSNYTVNNVYLKDAVITSEEDMLRHNIKQVQDIDERDEKSNSNR